MKAKDIKNAVKLLNRVRGNKSNYDTIRVISSENTLRILYKHGKGVVQVSIPDNESTDFDLHTSTSLLAFLNKVSTDVNITADSGSIFAETNNGCVGFGIDFDAVKIDIPPAILFESNCYGTPVDTDKIRRILYIAKSASVGRNSHLAYLYLDTSSDFLCTTDGVRLGAFGVTDNFNIDMAIPYESLRPFNIKSIKYDLYVNGEDKEFIITGDGFIYCSICENRNSYPDISSVIIDNYEASKYAFSIKHQVFLDVIKDIQPFVETHYNHGCCIIASAPKGTLEIFSDDGDGMEREYSREVPAIVSKNIKQARSLFRDKTIVSIEGRGALLSLNTDYLIDMLNTLQCDMLGVYQEAHTGAIFIRDAELFYALMPLKI